MADQFWPVDKLGNFIKTGKMIRLELPEAAGFFYIMDVKPATVLMEAGGGNIPVNGEITCVLKFSLPFTPDHRELMKAVVVEQPEEQKHHIGLQ